MYLKIIEHVSSAYSNISAHKYVGLLEGTQNIKTTSQL